MAASESTAGKLYKIDKNILIKSGQNQSTYYAKLFDSSSNEVGEFSIGKKKEESDIMDMNIHINDEYIENGMFNTKKARPVARLGYMDYGVVGQENIFSKNRPKLDSEGKLKEIDKWDGVYR